MMNESANISHDDGMVRRYVEFQFKQICELRFRIALHSGPGSAYRDWVKIRKITNQTSNKFMGIGALANRRTERLST